MFKELWGGAAGLKVNATSGAKVQVTTGGRDPDTTDASVEWRTIPPSRRNQRYSFQLECIKEPRMLANEN